MNNSINKRKHKPELSLKARALALLARRDYSRAELYTKLLPHADDPENLAKLLDEFSERGWQSDERTAQMRSETRSKRYGLLRLKQEMQRAGIATNIITNISETLKESELTRATELLQKKFGLAPTDHLIYAKYYRFLAQKGFNSETIKQAISALNSPLTNTSSELEDSQEKNSGVDSNSFYHIDEMDE